MMQVLSRQEPALELRRIGALIARKVDGLILIPSVDPSAAFDLIANAGIPTVVVDRASDDRRFDYVTIDDHGAMAEAAGALLRRGHRRLLYVLRYPGLVTTRQRMQSFRATVAAVRGATAEICVREPLEEAFARQVAAIMRRPDAPTAIIASNSEITLALLRIFIGLRIRYPQDVSMVAFDAPPWAEVLTPPLSVVQPPVAAIARKAWELLQARMEGGGGRRRHITLDATLVERASLAPPPAEPGRRRAPRAVRAA
jgi:LacI family transcriptional regulator